MYSQIKLKVHLLLDPADGHSKWDRVINTVIVSLIICNTIAVILETVESIYLPNKELFRGVEYVSVIVFSIEYILRVWSCTAIKKYEKPVIGRLKYITSIGAIIDLLAIIPFYLPLFRVYDLRFVRILRLLRFFRTSRSPDIRFS